MQIQFSALANREYDSTMRILSRLTFLSLITFWIVAVAFLAAAQSPLPGIIKSEFIYDTAPFPECHASTIAEAKDGLVAAWFGGSDEVYGAVHQRQKEFPETARRDV